MKSPKAIDDATAEEFGITPDVDVSKEIKIAWIRAQIDEMKKATLRSRIDIVLSEKLMESDIEQLAEKGRQNRTENRHLVKQFTGSVKVLNQFLAELAEPEK